MRSLARITRAAIAPSNVTPPWLLCFWRLVRGEAKGDFAAAWRLLPAALPIGVRCPTVAECALVLADHGLADR